MWFTLWVQGSCFRRVDGTAGGWGTESSADVAVRAGKLAVRRSLRADRAIHPFDAAPVLPAGSGLGYPAGDPGAVLSRRGADGGGAFAGGISAMRAACVRLGLMLFLVCQSASGTAATLEEILARMESAGKQVTSFSANIS